MGSIYEDLELASMMEYRYERPIRGGASCPDPRVALLELADAVCFEIELRGRNRVAAPATDLGSDSRDPRDGG